MAMRLATATLDEDKPDDAQDVARRIEAARSVDALQVQAARVDPVVVRLHADGEAVERIARLVSTLNTRLLARLWALLAPPALVAGSCLIVMGSEGRGEQILKTDQDNALLLRDGSLITLAVNPSPVCAWRELMTSVSTASTRVPEPRA